MTRTALPTRPRPRRDLGHRRGDGPPLRGRRRPAAPRRAQRPAARRGRRRSRARGAAGVETECLDLGARSDAGAALDRMVATLGGLDHVLLFYGILGDQERAEHDPAHARRDPRRELLARAAAWCLAAANLLEAQGHGIARGGRIGRGRPGTAVQLRLRRRQGRARRCSCRASRIASPCARAAALAPSGQAGLRRHADDRRPEEGRPALGDAGAGRGRSSDAPPTSGGPVVYAPWFWRWIMLVVRFVPAPIFHKLKL